MNHIEYRRNSQVVGMILSSHFAAAFNIVIPMTTCPLAFYPVDGRLTSSSVGNA